MEVKKALTERRTIRKFTQKKIPHSDLTGLVEYARMCAYPANMQPLKFLISDSESMNAAIFPHIKWAAYLKDGAPKKGEEPTAYIAVFGDTNIKNTFETEAGAAVTSMMLGALDKGLGSCWLGAIDRDELCKILIPERKNLTLLYLLALGYPAQKSRAVEMTDSIRYYEDENKVINVPKRKLSDILIEG